MTPREVIARVISMRDAETVEQYLLDAGYVILPAAEVVAMSEAVKLLSDSLRAMAPITAMNHRERVVEFIAQHRAMKGEKT